MALYSGRLSAILALLLAAGCFLIGRLGWLQLEDGSWLAQSSLGMRVQEIPLGAGRGNILDRSGRTLTNTGRRLSLFIFPRQVTEPRLSAARLAMASGQSAEFFLDCFKADHPLRADLEVDAPLADAINCLKLPGIVVIEEYLRYSRLAAHVIGYINSADNQGVSGIEAQCDALLRSQGREALGVFVDAGDRIIPGLGYRRLPPWPKDSPSNIVLTLDWRIQQLAEAAMDRRSTRGAVIVMQPYTGEILAMVSRPNFDAGCIGNYLQGQDAPLLNRALAAYQPGSVFKLVTAAAALDSQLARPDDSFFDPGYILVDNLRFNSWEHERGGRGLVTLTQAMAYSSNPVFIELGLKIGAKKLLDCAVSFGLGSTVLPGFPGEAAGNLPALDKLYAGDVANTAIGQGEVEVTPLQIAVLTAAVANGGKKVSPYLISKITNHDGKIIKEYGQRPATQVISANAAAQLQEMLAAVTSYGTGQAGRPDNVSAAGKTGTAETGRVNPAGQGISHAWFTGYAPYEQPQYVVVVLAEDGMSGSDVAAPLFQEIVSAIFAG